MIFKTFNNDIDKISAKWGIFGKSFNDIGTAISGKISDINKNFQATDDLIGSIKNSGDSIWARLYPTKEQIASLEIDVPELIDTTKANEYLNVMKQIDAGIHPMFKSYQDWHDELADGEKWIAKHAQSTQGQIRSLNDVTEANQQARQSALAHNAALKQQTLGAKAASVAMKGLASVANMAIGMLISWGISKAIEGIDELAHSAENCKERVDELMSSYESALNSANSNASRVKELSKNYEDLSKGVNNLGENVSLTNEQYEEYNSLVNEIAEMFPTLVQGYTDEGNAILSLKGNVEELTQAYKDAQVEAYNLLITGKDGEGNDIVQNFRNLQKTNNWSKIFDLGAEDVGGDLSTSEAIKELENFLKIESANRYKEIEKIITGGTGKQISSLVDFEQEVGRSVYLNKALDLDITSDTFEEDFNQARNKARGLISKYNAEIENALSNVESLANAYLNVSPDYAKLNKEQKEAASLIVNNLNEEIISQFKDSDDVGSYVNEMISIIAENADASSAIIGLHSLNFNELSIEDAKRWVDDYISTIAEILNEDENELKIRLGFEDFDSLYNNYNNITTTYAKKFAPYSDFDFTHETDAYKKYQATYEHLDEFAKNNSINTQDEIAFWEQCLDESKTRESAMRKYLLESPSITKISNIEHLSNIQSMESDLDKIGAIYKDVKDMETFDYSSILNNEEFSAIFSGYTEEYQKFIETISNSPDDINACQASFDDLVSAYINGKGFIEDVTDETKASTVAMLEQMGVTNANEIVTRALTISKERLRLESGACKDATLDEILAMYDAADAGTITKMVLAQLALEKKIINGTTIDTASDVEQIYNLAQSAGASAEVLEKLAWAKKVFESTGNGSYGNLYEYQKAKEFTDSLENGTYKIRFNIDDYRVDYNGEDNSSNYDKLSDYTDLLEKETTLLEKQLEAGLITFKDYTDKRKSIIEDYYRQGLISAEDYYSALEDMYDYQLSLYDKVIDAVNYRIDKEIDALEKEKESIEDTYNLKIKSIQTEIDELEKAREKREQQVELEKALYEVEKARSQRDVKLYSGSDKGFIYTNNGESLREAEENLENEKYESHISKLEEQIESLEKEMEKATDTIDEQINTLSDYADKWSDVADEYEHAQNDMLASQILGANYEEEILNQRMATLEIFKNNYIAAQNAMAEANRKVYETQVIGTQQNSNNSSGSKPPVNNDNEDKDPPKIEKERLTYGYYDKGKATSLIGYYNGDGIEQDDNGGWYVYKLKKYHTGLDEGYVGDKTPLSKDKRLDILQKAGNGVLLKPDEQLSILKNKELVLTEYQGINIADALWQKAMIPNMTLPNYNLDNIALRNNTPSQIVNIGDIHLHEVQNVPDFAKALQKHLPNISVQYNGKH